MQPLNSYQDIIVPAQDKRDMMIEQALEEFHESGECLDGEVTRDDIMSLDMVESLNTLGDRVLSDKLNFNDIEATKKDFHNFLMSRVEDEVDGLLFDEELKKAGL